jgi:hypothetical protein
MAKAAPKPKAMRSRRSGLKKAKLYQANHTVIKKLERALLGLK